MTDTARLAIPLIPETSLANADGINAAFEQIDDVAALDSDLDAHAADTSTHGVGEIVGRTETQTLTNKTLTAPTMSDPDVTGAIELTRASSAVENHYGATFQQDGAGGTFWVQVQRLNNAKVIMFRLVNAASNGGIDFLLAADTNVAEFRPIGSTSVMYLSTTGVQIKTALAVASIMSGGASTSQTITANDQTITVPTDGFVKVITTASARSGIRMGAGDKSGQVLILTNTSAFAMQFHLTESTSLVAGSAAGVFIPAQRSIQLTWFSTRWYAEAGA